MMKVLSNPGRLLVVDLLMSTEGMTVGDIAEATQLSQSNASQHLKALERAFCTPSETVRASDMLSDTRVSYGS